MAFDGTEGSRVTLTEASGWTENYRNEMGSGDPKAHFYGKEHIQAILDQEGCMGIRIYYAIDDDNKKVLVLVGADADEVDMEDIIVERGQKCPPYCSTSGGLNG